MTDPESWAKIVYSLWLLQEEHQRMPAADDARAIVERVTGHPMLLGGPTEIFSQRMPAYSPAHGEDDLAPIDVLYGHYDPQHLLVVCYVNRIRADAGRYAAAVQDLLTIVRIHEYAHAVVHTGLDLRRIEDQLSIFGVWDITDWNSFRASRDQAFVALDENSHELLAQAITWACLCHETAQVRSKHLPEIFLAVEARQPPPHRLSPHIRQRASSACWPLVLSTARGEIDDKRGSAFSMTEGLAALIAQTGKRNALTELPHDDPLAPMITELQRRLATADIPSPKTNTEANRLELLLLQKQHTELRMYKETAHHRPHFHIEYKNEFEATYALDSFERLAGYMPRKYEDHILGLAKENQNQLVGRWHSLNGPAKLALPQDDA
jgi:hypothetical protein